MSLTHSAFASTNKDARKQMTVKKATVTVLKTKVVRAKVRPVARYTASEDAIRQIEMRNDLRIETEGYERAEIVDLPVVRRAPPAQSATPSRVSLEF